MPRPPRPRRKSKQVSPASGELMEEDIKEEDFLNPPVSKVHSKGKTSLGEQSVELLHLLEPRYLLTDFPREMGEKSTRVMQEMRSLVPVQEAGNIDPLSSPTPLPLTLLSSQNISQALDFYLQCFYLYSKKDKSLTKLNPDINNLDREDAQYLFKLVFLPLALLENLNEIRGWVIETLLSSKTIYKDEEHLFLAQLFVYYWNLFEAVQTSCASCQRPKRKPADVGSEASEAVGSRLKLMAVHAEVLDTQEIDFALESSLREGKVLAVVSHLNFLMGRAVYKHFFEEAWNQASFDAEQSMVRQKEDILRVTKVGYKTEDWHGVQRIQKFILNVLDKSQAQPTGIGLPTNSLQTSPDAVPGEDSPVSQEQQKERRRNMEILIQGAKYLAKEKQQIIAQKKEKAERKRKKYIKAQRAKRIEELKKKLAYEYEQKRSQEQQAARQQLKHQPVI